MESMKIRNNIKTESVSPLRQICNPWWSSPKKTFANYVNVKDLSCFLEGTRSIGKLLKKVLTKEVVYFAPF